MNMLNLKNLKKQVMATTAALALGVLGACSSVESAKVDGSTIASNGEAVAVVQATNIGIYLLFNFVPLVPSDLDVVVNKLLVTEAKALGANKVELLSAMEYPKDGIFKWFGPTGLNWVNFPPAYASGVAVK